MRQSPLPVVLPADRRPDALGGIALHLDLLRVNLARSAEAIRKDGDRLVGSERKSVLTALCDGVIQGVARRLMFGDIAACAASGGAGARPRSATARAARGTGSA